MGSSASAVPPPGGPGKVQGPSSDLELAKISAAATPPAHPSTVLAQLNPDKPLSKPTSPEAVKKYVSQGMRAEKAIKDLENVIKELGYGPFGMFALFAAILVIGIVVHAFFYDGINELANLGEKEKKDYLKPLLDKTGGYLSAKINSAQRTLNDALEDNVITRMMDLAPVPALSSAQQEAAIHRIDNAINREISTEVQRFKGNENAKYRDDLRNALMRSSVLPSVPEADKKQDQGIKERQSRLLGVIINLNMLKSDVISGRQSTKNIENDIGIILRGTIKVPPKTSL